jgi:hypothetical protein
MYQAIIMVLVQVGWKGGKASGPNLHNHKRREQYPLPPLWDEGKSRLCGMFTPSREIVERKCTANEGPEIIHYKYLVPIYVFPEMKLRGLFISKTEL